MRKGGWEGVGGRAVQGSAQGATHVTSLTRSVMPNCRRTLSYSCCLNTSVSKKPALRVNAEWDGAGGGGGGGGG